MIEQFKEVRWKSTGAGILRGVVIACIPAGVSVKQVLPRGIDPRRLKTKKLTAAYERVLIRANKDGEEQYYAIKSAAVQQPKGRTNGEILSGNPEALAQALNRAAMDGCPPSYRCTPGKPRDCLTCWRRWVGRIAEEES